MAWVRTDFNQPVSINHVDRAASGTAECTVSGCLGHEASLQSSFGRIVTFLLCTWHSVIVCWTTNARQDIPTRLERQKSKEKWGEALGRLAGEIKGAIRPLPLRSSDEFATSVRRPKWFEGNWLIQMVLRCGPTAATFPNRARTRP